MKPLTQEQFEAICKFLKPHLSTVSEIVFKKQFKPQPEQPTLIPFDLTVALANPDRVVYRDGSKPLEWHLHAKIDSPWSITCVAENQIMGHRNDGTYHATIGRESNYDLFLLPEPKKEYWVNVYNKNASDFGFHFADTYTSEKEAVDNVFNSKSYTYLKTLSFTI